MSTNDDTVVIDLTKFEFHGIDLTGVPMPPTEEEKP